MILDWFIRAMVLLSLVGVFVTYSNQQQLSSCVADWANNFTRVSTVRAAANASRNDALHALLIDAIASPTQTQANKSQKALIEALTTGNPDKVIAAAKMRLADLEAAQGDPELIANVSEYIAADAAYRTTVQNHPLPEPPKEVC